MTTLNSPNFSRRALLKLTASGLLTWGLWPGALHAGDKNTTPFRCAILNDLHYFNDQCAPHFQRLVTTLNATSPALDLVIIAGDLTDNGTPAQNSALRDLLATLKMPFYVIPGNHDHRTQTDRQPFEQSFPKSINYTFDGNGWQFLGLDTTDGQKFDKVATPQATRDFLDQTLPRFDKERPLIVFTHFPLGPTAKYRLTDAEAFLERLKPFNLRHIFSGHYHAFTEKQFQGAPVTTNRCCSFHRNNHDGTKEKGYFLCTAADATLTRTFIEFPFPAPANPTP